MRPHTAALAATVPIPHRRAARVALLDATLSPTAYLDTVIEGSVEMASDRRRTCSFTVIDADGTLTPASAEDALYPNRLVRLERGIVVGGAPEYVSLGVFVIDKPSITVTPSSTTIRVTGQDRLKLALKSKFTTPVRYAEGTSLGDIIMEIAAAAGLGTELYRIDDGDKVLAAERIFDTTTVRIEAIQALATDYALDVYADADGYLVVAPTATADTLADTPVWTFARGEQAIMTGITKDFGDDRLYNHTLVSGEAADLPPVRAEARDLNPDSPGYNPPDGSGPIGDRLFEYTSAMIRTQEQAQDVADALLLSVALIEETISIPSAVHPALEVGDLVAVQEPASRTNDTYILETVSMPLGAGGMTVTSRKVRALT